MMGDYFPPPKEDEPWVILPNTSITEDLDPSFLIRFSPEWAPPEERDINQLKRLTPVRQEYARSCRDSLAAIGRWAVSADRETEPGRLGRESFLEPPPTSYAYVARGGGLWALINAGCIKAHPLQAFGPSMHLPGCSHPQGPTGVASVALTRTKGITRCGKRLLFAKVPFRWPSPLLSCHIDLSRGNVPTESAIREGMSALFNVYNPHQCVGFARVDEKTHPKRAARLGPFCGAPVLPSSTSSKSFQGWESSASSCQ